MPGARADVNVLTSLRDPTPVLVVAGGRVVAEDGHLTAALGPAPVPLTDAFDRPALPRLDAELLVPDGPRHGLRFVNDVITEILPPDQAPDGVLSAAVVDRRGRWITHGRVAGVAARLGGLATSFTSGFDVAVLGQDPADMALALRLLADDGGGIVLVERGAVLFRLAFDLGCWSSQPWAEVVAANRRLAGLLADRGYPFRDPVYSLLFLTFDSLPWIRLTSRGIWDVRRRRVIEPARPL